MPHQTDATPENFVPGSQALPALPGAWLVVALLVPVALLNYLDRQMLAAMKPSLTADLTDIQSQANWGLVITAV